MRFGFSLFVICALATGVQQARADQALAKAKHCMSCHALDKKIVGPAFLAVADKYRKDPSAANRLAVKVIKGGSGVWGVNYMPENKQVSPEEAQKLVAWVLSLK
jgi:cytochrome c